MGCFQSPEEEELSPSPKFAHIPTESNNILNFTLDTPTTNVDNDNDHNSNKNKHKKSNNDMIMWEYLEDINENLWRAYPSEISFEINECYNEKGKLSKCQIQNAMLSEAIEIDFEVMLETNVISGWQRKIRMCGNTNVNANPNMSEVGVANPLLSDGDCNNENGLNDSFIWQWYSESNGWKDYDFKLSSKIEGAYRSDLLRYAFKIRSSNVKYEIDFDDMQQCNLETCKYRQIRRQRDTEEQASELSDDCGRFVWEYYCHSKQKWTRYSDNISLKIETVFQAKAGIARMKIHGNPFEVRLDDSPMNHCNLKSNEVFELRRANLQNASAKSDLSRSKMVNCKKQKCVWKYKNGFNNWKAYPSKLNSEIESAYRAENTQFPFSMNGFSFLIEFLFLRETNLGTNEQKQIARIDDSVQRRTKSVYNNNNRSKNAGQSNGNGSVKKKKFKKQKRSQSIAGVTAAKKFDSLIEQQNKALKFYSKKRKESVSNVSQQIMINQEMESESAVDCESHVWKYLDSGIWCEYCAESNDIIETAFKNGQETAEITKNDGIHEIRFDLKREIHFATNRLRQIERHSKSAEKSKSKAHLRSMSANDDSVFVDPKMYQNVFESPVILDDSNEDLLSDSETELKDNDCDMNGEDIVDEFAQLSTGLDALSPPNFGDEHKALNVVCDDYDQYMKKFINYQHSVTDLST